MRERCILLVGVLLTFASWGVAGEKAETALEEFYIIEVHDCFQPPELNVGSLKDLRAAQKAASARNKAISMAFKSAAKQWAEAEKERVEKARELARKGKKKGNAPKAVMKPFLLKPPALITVRGDGPYESLDEAAAKAEERNKAIMKALDFEAASKKRKLELMSEHARKSIESQTALTEKQEELFLKELDSLAGKSSLLASGGKITRMGGKITRLDNNTHRMKKPGASAATATKVDKRAVMD